MKDKHHFLATGIGSLPFAEQEDAVRFVMDCFAADVPFWPQLPRRSFLESMHIQFSQGFPGVTIDAERKNIFINTKKASFIDEFERCYHALYAHEGDYFSLTDDYAAGFGAFVRALQPGKFPCVKGQVIGPVSFGMTLLDEAKKPIIFNAELNEIIPLFLANKAGWQIQRLAQAAGGKVIIFIDEPYLVGIGANEFASIDHQAIIAGLNTIIGAIHNRGAVAGIHCCGNTDWSLIFQTDVDIVSFDAFEFLESLFIYRQSMEAFVGRGGMFACGIVPNKPDYNFENYTQKASKILRRHEMLLANGAFITSSCGCGTLSEAIARRVNTLSVEIAHALEPLEEK